MKRFLIVLTLIFITNTTFAEERTILSKTSEDAYKSYRLANQELRELGFKLSEVNANNYYLYERKVRDLLYQVHVKLYKKKIKIDIYSFNPVKKQWRSKEFGKEVMDDIYKAITFRVENNTSIAPLSLPAFWGIIRNND